MGGSRVKVRCGAGVALACSNARVPRAAAPHSAALRPAGLPPERGRVCGVSLTQHGGGAGASGLGEPAAAGAWRENLRPRPDAFRGGEPAQQSIASWFAAALQRDPPNASQPRLPFSCMRMRAPTPQAALRAGAAATALPGASTACLVALGPDCRSASAVNLGTAALRCSVAARRRESCSVRSRHTVGMCWVGSPLRGAPCA